MKVFIIGNGDPQASKLASITTRRFTNALKNAGIALEFGYVNSTTSPIGILKNILRIRKKIKLSQPDIVHTHYGSVVGFIGLIASGQLPFVVTYCGDDLLGTPNPGISWRLREIFAVTLSKITAYFSTCFITVSQNLMDALPTFLHKKGKVIGYGINLDEFKLISKEDARIHLGWELGSKIILFNQSLGANQTVKNLPLAQSIKDLIAQKFPGVQLNLTGNSSYEDFIAKMNGSDCLLVTSFHEGSPNIVKEAMACNLPVFSVDCGDVKERLNKVTPGYVGQYDALELSKEMISFFSNPEKSNGREKLIQQQQTVEDITKNHIELYYSLIPELQKVNG